MTVRIACTFNFICAGLTLSVNHQNCTNALFVCMHVFNVCAGAGVILSVMVRMYSMLVRCRCDFKCDGENVMCRCGSKNIFSFVINKIKVYRVRCIVVKTYFYTCFNIKMHELQSYMHACMYFTQHTLYMTACSSRL